MGSAKEALSLELGLQRLFGETSYRVQRTPCRGKYRGRNDYALVFGSGRTLYLGVGMDNFLDGMREATTQIQYFRTHQAENTARIKEALLEHDTPFCDAAVDILPYDRSNDLIVYGVVLLTGKDGEKIVYRTTAMHYFLISGDNKWHTFKKCMAHLLEDACGERAYCRKLEGPAEPKPGRRPQRKKEDMVR